MMRSVSSSTHLPGTSYSTLPPWFLSSSDVSYIQHTAAVEVLHAMIPYILGNDYKICLEVDSYRVRYEVLPVQQ